MRIRGRGLSAAALSALLALPAPGFAQASGESSSSGAMAPISREAREEARQRFDRGLTLYNEGDWIGALAEFQVAYKLTGHAMVLYNLALVQARLGQAAEAVEALEKLRKSPASELAPGAAERAQTLYEAQLSRVGSLEVRSPTPGARVQIDNVDVARTPTGPIRVTAGPHFVAVSAAGHEPRHMKAIVAGRAHEVLEVELTPLTHSPAQVNVTCNVPAADVLTDGVLVGRTPLANSLTLTAGTHELELLRDGYAPARHKLVLQPGQATHLAVQMRPNEAGLKNGGTLALSVSESGAVVSVDGEPRLDANAGMQLPRGLHTIQVQRAGFYSLERQVSVEPGHRVIDATLLPTPAFLGDYVTRTRNQRTWSYVALGAGGLVAAASGAFLIWNQSEKSGAKTRFDDHADEIEARPGRQCDAECELTLSILTEDLARKRERDVYGWVGLSVGGLGLASGALLYLLGDDPKRYDTKPESDVFGSLEVRFGSRNVQLSGRF